MAGRQVTRMDLDYKVAGTVIAVRQAFESVIAVSAFLAQNPADAPSGDPLIVKFEYTADEAYLIRLVFEQLNALDVESVLAQGRKLTGLD